MIMLSPRVYYAMARDGVFLKVVAQFDPRFLTPVRAIGIMGLMTSLLIVLGAFETDHRLFPLCCGAVHLKTPLYPWTPLIFLLQVVALLAAILMRTPWQALLGCAVVLLGLPVFTFLQREHIVPPENALPVSENATEQ